MPSLAGPVWVCRARSRTSGSVRHAGQANPGIPRTYPRNRYPLLRCEFRARHRGLRLCNEPSVCVGDVVSDRYGDVRFVGAIDVLFIAVDDVLACAQPTKPTMINPTTAVRFLRKFRTPGRVWVECSHSGMPRKNASATTAVSSLSGLGAAACYGSCRMSLVGNNGFSHITNELASS